MTKRISRALVAALVVVLALGAAAPGTHGATVRDGAHSIHRRAIATGSSRPQLSPHLCLSKGCVKAAFHVLDKMDTSVDPCDDFYSFACGSFIDRTVIPDEKSSVSQFSLIDDELNLNMRKLIDAPVQAQDPPATVTLKKYFSSCMDKDGIEKKALDPMKSILKRMGGWPVLEGLSWDESSFDWAEAIYRNRELGFPNSYVFKFSVTADIKNYTRRMVNVNDASLGLGRKYLIKGFNDSDVQAYYSYMVDMAVLLGAEPEKAKSEMEDALRFEIELANISLPAEERRNISRLYNRRTLDEMTRVAPGIPWLTYTNRQLQPAGHTVFGNESINVEYIDYFKNFNDLLESTPKRVLANYMLWRAVRSSVDNLNMAARDARLKFYAQLYGSTEHKPRWKECLEDTISTMHIAAGSLYVKNHFDEDSKKAALELVADVHQQFNMMLQELSWMDDTTKQRAMEKSDAIEYYIAYPDKLLNETLVAEYYEELSVSDDDYFQNTLNARVFFTNKSFKKLREPVDKKDWKRHSKTAVVNAFYSAQDNSITISHYNVPRACLQGRQFDAEGKLQEWWQPETRNKFLDGAQCIIQQYGNITVDKANMSVNGITTQGENIADNGGMKIARRAYQLYQQKAGREPALPGLQHFTNEQMFWLGAANAWCSVYKEERLRLLLLTDSHAPSFVRINTSLRNTRLFAEDWQCPVGSRMNPADRCGVW
ncbi:Neprilysin-2 [Amphibalanus amphitrite]|uniref:Neprilysin-2 n=1 Tax=Amphibalanus amphitrite TaxID=1232801 RepID=A0A6A4V995_AMPAM|nr:Neprilysin-2 [Amphibalanus amphitrite]